MSVELIETDLELSDAELDAAIRANELEQCRLAAEHAASLSVSTVRGAHRMDGQRTVTSDLRATDNRSNGFVSQQQRPRLRQTPRTMAEPRRRTRPTIHHPTRRQHHAPRRRTRTRPHPRRTRPHRPIALPRATRPRAAGSGRLTPGRSASGCPGRHRHETTMWSTSTGPTPTCGVPNLCGGTDAARTPSRVLGGSGQRWRSSRVRTPRRPRRRPTLRRTRRP